MSRTSVASDVATALRLSAAAPTGAVAEALRGRLREQIKADADQADRYAHSLPEGRARDVAIETVRHARTLLAVPSGKDPVASLRLLAKGADYLSRYASAQESARRPAA
ncbi:hypothetical protein [Streptomyces sp. NBC_00347]|uniref:hypothetical protein n=1 Tax=Streptomyces sp. NBC_00347 TaxID=2975721 RepID=UPI00225A6C72|nr:hypothetical protein [Streptomyces sp. NBC_00347]MCX5124589.1 hypothetical protein [Streptomyces sp. NBC_00347]